MTRSEIAAAFAEEFERVAPDVEVSAGNPDDDLRDAFEIDSMDFLNLVTALHQRLGIDIPEADYAEMSTVNSAVDYLARRMGASG